MFWLREVFRAFHYTLFNARQKHNSEAKEKTEKEASQFIYGQCFIFKSDWEGKTRRKEAQKLFQRHYCTGCLVVDESFSCQPCNNSNCFGRHSYCKIVSAYINSESS